MSAVIVIPARYASTRFPGKPLARATGKFLIQHVVEQARKATRASRVLVATDDPRILDAVRSFNGEAVMTRADHHSGTDRIAEVMRHQEFADSRIVVNVQGDEPEIEPALIDRLIEALDDSSVQMATVAASFENAQEIANPNIVKVVIDRRRFALYFSRSVIPFNRDHDGKPASPPLGETMRSIYRKHLGIYAYRRDFLLTLAATPPCELEQLEKLEQLRALYLGAKIHVEDTPRAPHGIDTPEDYAAFVARAEAMEKRQAP